MAIAPYNYGSGAAPTPAPTKTAGKIAPFKYAATTPAAPPGLSPDEQALVNKIPAPAPVPAQTTFSLKPTAPAPFSTIKPAAPAPVLQAPLNPGVDLTNLNGKNALNSGFGENEPLAIKAPFIDKGTYTANDLPNQAIGGLVEWPERLARSIGQYVQSIATGGKFTAQDPSRANFTTQTTLEATKALNDQLTQNGLTPTQAAWISGLYGVSSGALDLLGLEGVLQKGVAKLAAQSVLAPEEVTAAKSLLGDPKTLAEAETSYRNLQKLSHPDMPGANTKLSTQASDAIRVLRQADKEGLLGQVARAAKTAQKPISEIGAPPKPPAKPVALLPETTGKIQPFDYSKIETPTPVTEKPVPVPQVTKKPEVPTEKSIVAEKSETPVEIKPIYETPYDIYAKGNYNIESLRVYREALIKAANEGKTISPEVLASVRNNFYRDEIKKAIESYGKEKSPEPMGQRKLTLVPGENTKGAAIRTKEGVPIGFPSQQLVTKTDLRNMADTLPGKEADFTVIEQNGKKFMSLESGGMKMLLRPSALGLVEDNIKVGDTIKVSKDELKSKGTAIRAVNEQGGAEASLLPGETKVHLNPTIGRELRTVLGEIKSDPGLSDAWKSLEKKIQKSDNLQLTKGEIKELRGELENIVDKDREEFPQNSRSAQKVLDSLPSKTGEDLSLANDLASGEVNPARSIAEIKQRIDQLNKFGQSKAILRRTGGLPKKAAGMFRYPRKGAPNPKGIPERGQVHLQDNVVANDKAYVETLAHELGHALEFTLTGSTNKDMFRVFGKDLSDEVKNTIRAELKANTNKMVGEETAKAGAGYYYKNTELLARFLENMFVKPGEVAELAPTALKYFEQSAVETPIVGEYLDAVKGEIDKGQLKHVFLRDMKETYVKVLGKRVGELAWNDELRYRAMKERAKIQVEKLIKSKFKGVKDDPEQLFRSAESILITKDDKPVFGTRDFQLAKTDAEAAKLMAGGYEPLLDGEGTIVSQIVDGKIVPRFAKPRYTAAQGKRIFDSLSPEGQKLIKDFTAARAEAKDYFNREVIKDVHKINTDLEGWVHHFWEEKGTGIGGDKLKTKIAAAKKLRTGAEGYVEDLQKAMTKALTELETAKAYNAFIEDYFARVSRPIAEGEDPLPGYVEVQGNVRKGGVGRPSEVKKIIIENGKATLAKNVRYQMPAEIYQRFQMIRELAVEASTAAKVMNSINRYWRVNILFYPGSAATNMISGALQYSTKVINDFYVEALTGDLAFPRSRQNVFSMITATTPKGWQAAPDWIYGGDLSNWYGEFGSKKTPGVLGTKVDEGIDQYADKALKFYGAVERYWKKVISLSEGSSKLGSLNQMTTEGLRLPNDEEKALLDQMNKEIDLYAYDYDNVPNWLSAHQQSAFGQSIKPFAKYPYKYTKQLTEMATAAFDGTLPWQERVAKIMTLATVASLYAAAANKRKSQQTTPEVGPNAPPSVSTRGRLFMGTDSNGKEIFMRVAKYPFLNVTEAGIQLINGHSDTALQLMQDMMGSISPIGDVGMAAMGYGNQYQTYQPVASRIGQDVATFIPASRMLADIARFFDPYQRKQTTFLQGITSLYPTTDPMLQQKLHGDIKTIQVPLENGVQPQPGEKPTRTTTDQDVLNYKTDLLLGLLAGLYETRIDPNVAAAFNTRDAENKAAADARAKREELQKLVK